MSASLYLKLCGVPFPSKYLFSKSLHTVIFCPKGEWRENFINKDIQIENYRISDNNIFENGLGRSSEYHLSIKRPTNKFKKKFIERIFYEKYPGLKDRQMSPNVKFKRDMEKEKEENKVSNNISLRSIFKNK